MEPELHATAKPPLINCHTHIFTGDHVPPYLAKTFLPLGLYYLFPLSMVVSLFRWYYNGPDRWKYRSWYKKVKLIIYQIKMHVLRNIVLRLLGYLLGTWLAVHALFILFDWLARLVTPDGSLTSILEDARNWLSERNLLLIPESSLLKWLIITVVFLFFATGRNLILFLFKKTWSFFKFLPGPQTKELIHRYINIGRFSFHREQAENFKRLRNQYPDDSGFVVLPMDMEFMDAGRTRQNYREQMQELADIKENKNYKDRFFPFVFVDPRRIRKETDYFRYHLESGKIILDDCFIREYIEVRQFSGFKIYPALGYYPFDEALLPVWKYAAQNSLPILTHCIRGNIYFRGAKIKVWDYHPVFEQAAGDSRYEPLLLSQMKNIDFINNFTHPLNYLCLLEEKLLRKIVSQSKDPGIKIIFGYSGLDTALTSDLHELKICFGHFGGGDEWTRFLELDRDNYSSQLIKQPHCGINFLTNEVGDPRPGKAEQIWKNVDWYSIICSLMLQYPHIYSDLSYILHDLAIQPLLKHTMQNDRLKYRVLFGTDFYVVRNHKSEKHMLADMLDHLSEEEFDRVSRYNPREFLKNAIHGPLKI